MMNYNIKYTALCDKGLVRAKNQDNFWCMGKFLARENDGLTEPIIDMVSTKNLPAFAIFDGMGGEQQGEAAAHIAASYFDIIYKESLKDNKDNIQQFLLHACARMNNSICEYVKNQQIQRSGSTAAIIMFGKKNIYICNIGDSRIYQFSDNTLTQISHDHCEVSATMRKTPLSQNLGIPEVEFIIAPYVAKGLYTYGDKYLICSDGLTDMITDDKIAEMMTENNSITQCAKNLLQQALEAGGNDNITIIICEIHRQRRIFPLRGNKIK